MLVVGIIAYPAKWESITERPLSYWAPWALALALWIFGARKFWDSSQWIYDHAHESAANVMFVFIGLVVINISYHKWRDEHTRVRTQAPAVKLRFYQRKPGAIAYGAIAAFMVIGFLLFRGLPDALPTKVYEHRTFWLEAWEIVLLAAFWIFQTWDRWNEGAPPRTDDEAERMGAPESTTITVVG